MKDKITIMHILAVIGIAAPLSIIAVLLFKESEPSALVSGFIGTIIGSYVTVYGYYFGSSSGSKSKQDTIDKMTSEPEIPKV